MGFVVADGAVRKQVAHSESDRRSSFLSHGCFQRKRCWCSRWVCHVLHYVVFEVIVNIWKNKTEKKTCLSTTLPTLLVDSFSPLFTICDC